MANTYTQLYTHFVFAVQNRMCLLHEKWRSEIFLYMSGIAEQHGHKLYIANGMSDHVHTLISINPKQSQSDLMYHLKRSSSILINEKKLTPGHFSWQEGFGAFSVSKSDVNRVYKYIEKQQEHHKTVMFRDEYISFLKEYEVEYNEKYIFHDID